MKNRNFGLDVVRMCAILPVLVGHYASCAIKDTPRILFVLGDLGVVLFFALSGFLIGGIILRDFERGFSWKVALNFYVRRWMRTVPLYWTFFLVSMFVTYWGLTLDHGWTAKCLSYLVFLQNLAWPMPHWFEESWSLAVEEWFYLLFPILFALCAGFRPRTRILMIALTLIVIPPVLRMVAYDPTLDFDLHFRRVVVFRLDAIAYGILAAWAVYTFDMKRWANLIGVVGFVGADITILLMLYVFQLGDFFTRTLTMSVASASFAAIVLWANFQKWEEVPVVKWLSTRSYALYLCNVTMLKTMLHHGLFGVAPVASALIFFPSCMLIAEVAHRLIEQPFMRRRPREIHTRAAVLDKPYPRAESA